MDPTQKLIARRLLRLRVHEAKGIDFQRLLEQVFCYRWTDFTPVASWGSAGDRKNDGYIPTSGTYFQVYAPLDPECKETISTAAAKARGDFEGLRTHWQATGPIRAFRFAFNDEYRGSPAPVELSLSGIRSDFGVDARAFLAKDLEDEALQLQDDQLLDVIRCPLPELGVLSAVDYGVLGEVVQHVLRSRKPIGRSSALIAPEFDEKIKINALTAPVASLLSVGSFQSDAVMDYFSRNSRFARQALRDQLAAHYLESRARFEKSALPIEEISDLVFFDLLDLVTPPHRQDSTEFREAAVIVLAYYFEACDIFEDPRALT